MRFRRNAFWFFELLISLIAADAVCAIVLLVEPQTMIPMIFALVLVTACLLPNVFIEGSTYIFVDEVCIQCKRQDQLIWSYKWDEIQELRKCSVYRNPGIRIFLKSEPRNDLQVVQNTPVADFQHSPAAKKALRNFTSLYK